jgi:hypothetical protein
MLGSIKPPKSSMYERTEITQEQMFSDIFGVAWQKKVIITVFNDTMWNAFVPCGIRPTKYDIRYQRPNETIYNMRGFRADVIILNVNDLPSTEIIGDIFVPLVLMDTVCFLRKNNGNYIKIDVNDLIEMCSDAFPTKIAESTKSTTDKTNQ